MSGSTLIAKIVNCDQVRVNSGMQSTLQSSAPNIVNLKLNIVAMQSTLQSSASNAVNLKLNIVAMQIVTGLK